MRSSMLLLLQLCKYSLVNCNIISDTYIVHSEGYKCIGDVSRRGNALRLPGVSIVSCRANMGTCTKIVGKRKALPLRVYWYMTIRGGGSRASTSCGDITGLSSA